MYRYFLINMFVVFSLSASCIQEPKPQSKKTLTATEQENKDQTQRSLFDIPDDEIINGYKASLLKQIVKEEGYKESVVMDPFFEYNPF